MPSLPSSNEERTTVDEQLRHRDAELRQSADVEQLLRESEGYFRDLMQAMPHVVWTNLPDGRVDFMNRRWEEYTGQVAERIASLPEAWASAMHPEDHAAARRIYEDSTRKVEGFSFEARLRRESDRAYRWHLLRSVPLRDRRRDVFKFLGTCTDIEELKKAERALLDADRRKDEFMAILSHELRNPLGAIRNAAQIMRVAGDDPEKAATAREILQRQIDQMILLVDDLLDLSRIVEGKVVFHRAVTPLASVVETAVETTRARLVKKEHELAVSIPHEPVYVDVDPNRMTQVLTNLLTNAIKFTPRGGKIALEVEVKPGGLRPVRGPRVGTEDAPPESHLEIRVRDNGIGMSAEFLPRVFEMFVQADHSLARNLGGLGVGLTLVRSLVQMHDGTVAIHSEGLGKGCEVTVRLPIAAPRVLAEAGPQRDARASPVGPAASRRILLVEDNRDHAESLRALLQLAGHEVRVALDGTEGLEIAREFAPEVALIDIGLPGLNGYEVAQRMREMPGLEKATLAALTGYGQESDRRRGERAGFDHHFVKPVDFQELRRWLEPVPKA